MLNRRVAKLYFLFFIRVSEFIADAASAVSV